jgi:hypothetical protein
MTWKRDSIWDIIATPAQMQRFGITENFDAVRSDPRNVDYLKPLANRKAEEEAWVFAEAVYGFIADEYGGFDSAEDSNWCFEQCLINGRKFECEPEYAAIFENMGGEKSPPEKAKRRLLH